MAGKSYVPSTRVPSLAGGKSSTFDPLNLVKVSSNPLATTATETIHSLEKQKALKVDKRSNQESDSWVNQLDDWKSRRRSGQPRAGELEWSISEEPLPDVEATSCRTSVKLRSGLAFVEPSETSSWGEDPFCFAEATVKPPQVPEDSFGATQKISTADYSKWAASPVRIRDEVSTPTTSVDSNVPKSGASRIRNYDVADCRSRSTATASFAGATGSARKVETEEPAMRCNAPTSNQARPKSFMHVGSAGAPKVPQKSFKLTKNEPASKGPGEDVPQKNSSTVDEKRARASVQNFNKIKSFFETASQEVERSDSDVKGSRPVVRMRNNPVAVDAKKRTSLAPGVLERASRGSGIAIANDKEYIIDEHFVNKPDRRNFPIISTNSESESHFTPSNLPADATPRKQSVGRVYSFSTDVENPATPQGDISLEDFKGMIYSPNPAASSRKSPDAKRHTPTNDSHAASAEIVVRPKNDEDLLGGESAVPLKVSTFVQQDKEKEKTYVHEHRNGDDNKALNVVKEVDVKCCRPERVPSIKKAGQREDFLFELEEDVFGDKVSSIPPHKDKSLVSGNNDKTDPACRDDRNMITTSQKDTTQVLVETEWLLDTKVNNDFIKDTRISSSILRPKSSFTSEPRNNFNLTEMRSLFFNPLSTSRAASDDSKHPPNHVERSPLEGDRLSKGNVSSTSTTNATSTFEINLSSPTKEKKIPDSVTFKVNQPKFVDVSFKIKDQEKVAGIDDTDTGRTKLEDAISELKFYPTVVKDNKPADSATSAARQSQRTPVLDKSKDLQEINSNIDYADGNIGSKGSNIYIINSHKEPPPETRSLQTVAKDDKTSDFMVSKTEKEIILTGNHELHAPTPTDRKFNTPKPSVLPKVPPKPSPRSNLDISKISAIFSNALLAPTSGGRFVCSEKKTPDSGIDLNSKANVTLLDVSATRDRVELSRKNRRRPPSSYSSTKDSLDGSLTFTPSKDDVLVDIDDDVDDARLIRTPEKRKEVHQKTELYDERESQTPPALPSRPPPGLQTTMPYSEEIQVLTILQPSDHTGRHPSKGMNLSETLVLKNDDSNSDSDDMLPESSV